MLPPLRGIGEPIRVEAHSLQSCRRGSRKVQVRRFVGSVCGRFEKELPDERWRRRRVSSPTLFDESPFQLWPGSVPCSFR